MYVFVKDYLFMMCTPHMNFKARASYRKRTFLYIDELVDQGFITRRTLQ